MLPQEQQTRSPRSWAPQGRPGALRSLSPCAASSPALPAAAAAQRGAAATRADRGAPAPWFRRRTLKGSRALLCFSSRESRPTPGITPRRRRGSAPLRPHKPPWTWDSGPLPTRSKPAERPRQRRFLQPLSHPVPRKGRRQRGATYAARARLPAAAGAAELRWQRRDALGSQSWGAPPLSLLSSPIPALLLPSGAGQPAPLRGAEGQRLWGSSLRGRTGVYPGEGGPARPGTAVSERVQVPPPSQTHCTPREGPLESRSVLSFPATTGFSNLALPRVL